MVVTETNCAILQGTIISELKFSHKTYGEGFYETVLSVERKSGYCDEIRLVLSDRLLWDTVVCVGSKLKVEGQIRTYNEESDGKSHLNIVVFVRQLYPWESGCCENYIYLEGFVCKPTVRRTSPLGREICDIMLAVNRMYNKSDYIPCVAWGRNAAYAGALEVGDKLVITGRLQSRDYKKRMEDGEIRLKTAYEVSILKIDE